MNTNSKKIFVQLLAVVMLVLHSLNGFSTPKDKKTDHEKQRFEADAAAVAYINCKYDLKKYYSETKPDDQQLQKELKEVSLLKLQFNLQVAGKYKTPAEEFEKFSREVENIKPKLKTCKKYQNILTANEKLKEIK